MLKTAKNFKDEEFTYNSEYTVFFKFIDDDSYYIYSVLDFEDEGFSIEKINQEIYNKLTLETVDPIILSVEDTMDMVAKIATVRAIADKNLRSLGEELGLADIKLPKYLLEDGIDRK